MCSLVSVIIAEAGPRFWPPILNAENISELWDFKEQDIMI